MTPTELSQKEQLIAQLKELDNGFLIQRIADFMQGLLAASNDNDWWQDLPPSIREQYDKSLAEMEAGQENNVEDFLKKYHS